MGGKKFQEKMFAVISVIRRACDVTEKKKLHMMKASNVEGDRPFCCHRQYWTDVTGEAVI